MFDLLTGMTPTPLHGCILRGSTSMANKNIKWWRLSDVTRVVAAQHTTPAAHGRRLMIRLVTSIKHAPVWTNCIIAYLKWSAYYSQTCSLNMKKTVRRNVINVRDTYLLFLTHPVYICITRVWRASRSFKAKLQASISIFWVITRISQTQISQDLYWNHSVQLLFEHWQFFIFTIVF